jgi:hypothetical protein
MYSPGDWGVALLAAGATEIKYFLWFLDLNPLSRRTFRTSLDFRDPNANKTPAMAPQMVPLQRS